MFGRSLVLNQDMNKNQIIDKIRYPIKNLVVVYNIKTIKIY